MFNAELCGVSLVAALRSSEWMALVSEDANQSRQCVRRSHFMKPTMRACDAASECISDFGTALFIPLKSFAVWSAHSVPAVYACVYPFGDFFFTSNEHETNVKKINIHIYSSRAINFLARITSMGEFYLPPSLCLCSILLYIAFWIAMKA